MENKRFYTPNAFRICVDDVIPGGVIGRACHRASEEPIRFNEVGRLIVTMDEVFDRLNYPQASTKIRTFGKRQRTSDKKENEIMANEFDLNQKGEKATFVIQVQYRQNATWQGKVTWAEKDDTKPFRSALELIKLIDSALDNEGV